MAWTAKVSSLPSDRIKAQKQPSKGTKTPPRPKRSERYTQLNSILEGLLQSASGGGKSGGPCFCLGRAGHTLSPYTPLCLSCGLILCEYNMPYWPCPHCSESLVPATSRQYLIERIRGEMKQVLDLEEAKRVREEEERQQAIGAFPLLPGHRTPPSRASTPPAHKVLSLDTRSKKVTISSYTTIPAAPKEAKEEIIRVPRPPSEVDYVRVKDGTRGRKYEDLTGGGARYVPIVKNESAKKKKKG